MCPDDVDAIYDIYEGNDLSYTEPLYEDRDKEREYIKDYQKYIYNFYDFGIWLFVEKDTGDIIGRGGVEFKLYDDGTEGFETGYIIRKDRQRMGYAYEALSRILMYLQEHFDIEKINVRIHKDNIPSIELAKKLGAKFDLTAGSQNNDEEYMLGTIKLI